jgi:hypothetical protein
MRKRKYLIGLTLALAASVAVSGIAQGAVTGQKLTVTVGKSKQDRKLRGPSDINVTVDTTEVPPTPAAQTAQQTVVNFDPDFDLGNTANFGECDPATLANTTTDQAKALCAGKEVGSGDSTVCSALSGCGVTQLPGVVTAFNGVPSGGNPAIILHNRIGPPANVTTVLTGVLNGNVLTVSVPDTAATGLHLTHFFTGIPVLKTGTQKAKGKKGGKKKSTPLYYITARCSKKVWNFSETTTFRAGGPSQSASTTTPCTQKKAKKKKKK